MALNMAAFTRGAVVSMVAVLFMASQMEAAPAPAPAPQVPGLAPGALLTGLVAPALMTVFSFFVLRHL
jgi:hypothetical protein